jgi:hypothetical protein
MANMDYCEKRGSGRGYRETRDLVAVGYREAQGLAAHRLSQNTRFSHRRHLRKKDFPAYRDNLRFKALL